MTAPPRQRAVDRQTGLAIEAAIASRARARWTTLLLVRLFGERWQVDCGGCRHRLGRWRGRWYHLGMRDLRA